MKRFGPILLAVLGAAVVHAQTHTVVTYEGAWSSTPTYVKSAVVTEAGSTYVSVQSGNINHDPAADTGHTWWAPLPGGTTFNGGTVANPIIAPSFTANGANAGSFTMTAGPAPSAPTNSIVLAAPSAVTTPYVFSLPAAPPGSTALTISCTGTTVTICNWMTASSGAGLGNGLSTGVNSGTYSVLSWNGSYANGLDLGFLADTSGTDKNMYEDVPAGGKHVVRIANTDIAEWGAAGGNYYDLALNGNHTDAGRQGLVWDASHASKDIDWDTPSGGSQLFRVGGVGVFQVGGTTAPTAGAACTSNVYFLTQDGHLTWCNGSTWVTKF